MNYRVRVLPLAIEDLQEIYNYIAYELQSVINAENQLSRLQDEIQKLDFMPESFRLYEKEPWKSRGLRYFSIIGSTLTILKPSASQPNKGNATSLILYSL